MIKHLILLGALLALTPPAALAVLDSTADECGAVYGSPPNISPFAGPPGKHRAYLWSGILVDASFPGVDAPGSRCTSVWYEMEHNLIRKGTQEMTRAEIERFLALNAGDSSWENVRRVWRRRDNRAFAIEFRYHRNEIPANTLAIFLGESDPTSAAKVSAAFNRR